jgi:hypothetical protein
MGIMARVVQRILSVVTGGHGKCPISSSVLFLCPPRPCPPPTPHLWFSVFGVVVGAASEFGVEMTVTAVEMYVEEMRDLLQPASATSAGGVVHEIRLDTEGNPYLSDVVTVSSILQSYIGAHILCRR